MDAPIGQEDHPPVARPSRDDVVFVIDDRGAVLAESGPGAAEWRDDPSVQDIVAAARKSDRTPEPVHLEDGDRVVRVEAFAADDLVVVHVVDARDELEERLLAQAYDSLGDGLAVVVALDGTVCHASGGLRRLAGGGFLGADLFEIVAAEDRPDLLALVAGLAAPMGAPPAPPTTRIQAADGSWRSIVWQRAPLGDRVLLVGADITTSRDLALLDAHRHALVARLGGAAGDAALLSGAERLEALAPGVRVAIYRAPSDELQLLSAPRLPRSFALAAATLELPTEVDPDALDGRLFPLGGTTANIAARLDLGFAWVRFAIGAGHRPVGAVVVFVGAKRFVHDDERAIIDDLAALLEADAHIAAQLDAPRIWAESDRLTGLEARAAFLDLMGDDDAEHRGAVVVHVHDIAALNDAEGLAAGDAALHTVAATIRGAVRERDRVVRWSGTRFVVLGLARRDRMSVDALTNRVREALEGRMLVAGQARHLRCSVAGTDGRSGETVAELVQRVEAMATDVTTVSGPAVCDR